MVVPRCCLLSSLLPIVCTLLLGILPSVVLSRMENLAFSFENEGGFLCIYDRANGEHCEDDVNHIHLRMRYIYEVSESTDVILSGIRDLSSTIFERSPVRGTSVSGINADMFSIATDLFPKGITGLDLYLMRGTGNITNNHGGTNHHVDSFDTKLDIVVSDWPFCDQCSSMGTRNMDTLNPLRLPQIEGEETVDLPSVRQGGGGNSNQGKYIDIAFSVIGRTQREYGVMNSIGSDGLEFGLGGSISLRLSTKINVDGTWIDMPHGFPATDTLADGTTVFVIRFPRFSTSVRYDPIILTTSQSSETASVDLISTLAIKTNGTMPPGTLTTGADNTTDNGNFSEAPSPVTQTEESSLSDTEENSENNTPNDDLVDDETGTTNEKDDNEWTHILSAAPSLYLVGPIGTMVAAVVLSLV